MPRELDPTGADGRHAPQEREGAMRVQTKVLLSLVLGAGVFAVYLVRLEAGRQEAKGGNLELPSAAEPGMSKLSSGVSERKLAGYLHRSDPPLDPGRPRLDPYTLDPGSFSSARDLLQQYWGSLWSEVEQEINAAGVDLSTIDVKQIKPWSVARTMLQERLAQGIDQGPVFQGASEAASALQAQWSQLLDSTSLAKEDRLLLEERRRTFERQRASVTSNLKSKLLELKLNALEDPRHAILHPIVFPHKTVKTPSLYPSDYAVCESVMMDGWTLLVLVRREEVPGFDDWTRDIQDLLEREAAYLGSQTSFPAAKEPVHR